MRQKKMNIFCNREEYSFKRYSRESSSTRVKQVPKNDVLHILGTDGSSTKHGKASLHKVHESTRKDQVKGIHTTSKRSSFF